MNPLEIFCSLKEVGFSYDKEISKKIQLDYSEDFKKILETNSISFENQNSFIVIERKNLPFAFFEDINEFQSQIKLTDFEKPIIINSFNNTDPIYFSNSYDIQIIDKLPNENYLISNAKTFLESIGYFKSKYDENEVNFEFIDDFSLSNRTITFSSISEKKRLKFIFTPTGVIEMNTSVNYSTKFDEFKSLMLESKQYPVFLKKSLIKHLLNSSLNPYVSFFEKIDQIILEAKLDFNVYLHELSIDKIKAEYKDYKQQYFSSQNEILNKLTNQIIAVPISISATVFAISRLEGKGLPLFIVSFGLLCYIGYVTFLIKFFVRDILALHSQSSHDYKNLYDQSFFRENEDELTYFKQVKSSIDNRLSDLYLGLKCFTVIMWVSSGLILVYVLSHFIDFSNYNKDLFFFVIPLILFIYLFSEILFKEKLNDTNE
jgi:hypothetical protein